MDFKKLLEEIRDSLSQVIKQQGPRGKMLWESLIQMHPKDIADLLSDIPKEEAHALFVALPKELRLEIFDDLNDSMKVFVLTLLSEENQIEAFDSLSTDEITDLFDHFSDPELKKYLGLLHKGVREKVLRLLKFDPESAGGIMHTDILSLMDDYTVEKSIKIIQRLSPKRDIHQYIFVTNRDYRLVGHINLEDLVLHKPEVRIGSLVRPNELVVSADEDQETVAKKMVHYGMMTVPVVDQKNHFLGIIASETLVDIIVEEAAEDAHKMAALTPLKYPYFESSFLRMFLERSFILVALLWIESFSTTIMHVHESTLNSFLLFFIPMLISVGGNTSNQTSTVVIQGMASGEIGFFNMMRFLKRELLMATLLSSILCVASFARVYVSSGILLESVVVSVSLALIVFASVVLGSIMPFVLKKLRIDPAFSAGPFLATVMDILGITIYCSMIKMFLF